MLSLATPKDVETSLVRSLTPSEEPHVEALLERAESLIRERVSDFADLVSDTEARDTGFIGKVVHITADAVARVLRNPEAFRQETEGNYSYTLDREAASGLLSISDEEWARLGISSRSEYGTLSVGFDGYAKSRFGNARPDLVFQFGWPGDKPGMSERII